MPLTCKIFIHNLRLDALIGIHPHEQTTPQPLLISIELERATAPTEDKLKSTFCYDQLAARVEQIAQKQFNLAETLASAIADDCLRYEEIVSARVSVKKLQALAKADYAGVEIFRSNR